MSFIDGRILTFAVIFWIAAWGSGLEIVKHIVEGAETLIREISK